MATTNRIEKAYNSWRTFSFFLFFYFVVPLISGWLFVASFNSHALTIYKLARLETLLKLASLGRTREERRKKKRKGEKKFLILNQNSI